VEIDEVTMTMEGDSFWYMPLIVASLAWATSCVELLFAEVVVDALVVMVELLPTISIAAPAPAPPESTLSMSMAATNSPARPPLLFLVFSGSGR
jgi:hypothetical protein